MKLIANQITNLTDARYFAARGLDGLIFDLEKMDPKEVLAIVEWIAGPDIIIHTNQPESLDAAVASIAKAIWTDTTGWSLPVTTYRSWSKILSAPSEDPTAWIVSEDNWDEFVQSKQYGSPVILWLNYPDTKWLNEAGTHSLWALMIDGGEEELTGIKSFEDYDDFIDAWEELVAE
ncbi:MAG: hypothetical protein R2806_12545 [Saprospiraceae bacterium]